ncbi:hypothetical protein J6590_092018 [Homalodisca vitripennis]|nr:hypothetical protein J6590_092018 [Homalodisca vitripennis]
MFKEHVGVYGCPERVERAMPPLQAYTYSASCCFCRQDGDYVLRFHIHLSIRSAEVDRGSVSRALAISINSNTIGGILVLRSHLYLIIRSAEVDRGSVSRALAISINSTTIGGLLVRAAGISRYINMY